MLTKPKPSKKREIDDTSDEYFETMKKQMLMTSLTGTQDNLSGSGDVRFLTFHFDILTDNRKQEFDEFI